MRMSPNDKPRASSANRTFTLVLLALGALVFGWEFVELSLGPDPVQLALLRDEAQ